ncbi:hypothetical protein C0992_005480, partial [Termitomyces sp. T32_za158]
AQLRREREKERTPAQIQRAQDKESKRARGALDVFVLILTRADASTGALSCAECRRLKLKCDKTVPCSSFVLADTEKLHQKIAAMSDRIRQLEDALAILQSTHTRDPHPLLARDLLKIKSIIELHAAGDSLDDPAAFGAAGGSARTREEEDTEESQAIDAFGTLAIRDDGAATFYGRSAGQETHATELTVSYQSQGEASPTSFSPISETQPWTPTATLPPTIKSLASSFPFPPTPSNGPSSSTFPSRTLQRDTPIDFHTLTHTYLPPWPETRRLCASYLEQAPWFFGAVTRRQLEEEILPTWYAEAPAPPPPPPTTAPAHALPTPHAALPPAQQQGQIVIVCTRGLQTLSTLMVTNQSLATGRLATFSLPFVDCELPFDSDQTMTDDGVIQPSFPFWKARFGAECVAGVVQGTLTSRAPKYSIILDLDRKVRDMELPAYAQGPPPQGAGLAETMSHFMPINYRELTLLYIHRCFFAHAISSNSADPIKSQYAPSFLAGYRSACTIIGSVSQQFMLFPAQIARFWVLWTHAFSAAVMLASVVTHSSRSKVAPAALLELRIACDLFERASVYGGRSSKFLPILQRLHNKAQKVFMDTNSGIPPSVPGDIFKPTAAGGERKDELSIFSGKTHTLTTKAAPRVRPTTATTASSSSPSSSSVSDSPSGPSNAFVPVDNPSFANVHPSLVRELRGFDGHIAAQIREAYGASGVGFASRMEASQQERRHIQMEAAQRERAERDEQERRRQIQLEQQQQLYQEQKEEEERRWQLQEQEEDYIRQRAIHEQQAQLQMVLDRQRQQQPRQHQPHVHRQQQEQAPSQHFEQHYENGHYVEHTSVGLPTHHDTHPMSSHSHNQMESIYGQLERPTRPQPQHSMYAMPSEYPNTIHQQLASLQQPVSSTQHHEQSYSTHSVTRVHKARQVSDYQPTEAIQSVASDEMDYEQYTDHAQLQGHRPQKQHSQLTHYGTYQYATPHDTPYPSVDSVTQLHGLYGHLQQQNQQYTPDGVLRGIAADDTSLQETWQSYMYKVGSPRQFLED